MIGNFPPDVIGWAATAIFTASYFARQPHTLRRVQMGGAAMWMAYGATTGALPVVTANALVLCAAVWAEYRTRNRDITDAPSASPRSSRMR